MKYELKDKKTGNSVDFTSIIIKQMMGELTREDVLKIIERTKKEMEVNNV